MTDTIARLRAGKSIFETMVDLENAMKLKKGEDMDMSEIIRDTAIYTDQKKGMHAGNAELENAFNTTDFQEIVKKIIQKGDLEVTQEFRDEETEQKRKQVIDFLTRNAVDPRTSRPYTPDILENTIKQAGASIKNIPIEKQINEILESLKRIIPIKIETKKIKIKIPAMHTGRVYGLVQEHKEKEDWLPNGDLEVTLNIPIGIQMEFYDKLNSITHGSAITEEMKE